MNRSTLLLSVLLMLPFGLSAQTTHTFTFGQFVRDSYTGMVTGTAEMQTLDGIPADQGTGYAGVIMVPYNDSPWWGLECPQEWGFPNNCFLTNNTTTPQLSGPFFTAPNCTLNTGGCVYYETGTAEFVGYGQGVTVSVVVWFQVHTHHYCGRGGCHTYYSDDETNGTGTATY